MCLLSLTQSRWVPFSALSLPEQFRYKRRVYAQNLIDDKQFAKLHTKVRRQPQQGYSKVIFCTPSSPLPTMASAPLAQP